MAWAIDLDGVMWLGEVPIAGSADAVRRLQDRGETVLFVTNNSSATVAAVEARLEAQGIDARGAVITSAGAAARLVEPGARALVVGGPGILEALRDRGVEVVDGDATGEAAPDVVLVGFTRAFDFDLLAAATRAVRGGATLIGTNGDPTYPTPQGQVPGGGAILAAVATASGVTPIVAGKPHEPMAALVRARGGTRGTMVGDRPDTDGAFARELGYRFALVLSGVTGPGRDVVPRPDVVAADLAGVVALVAPGV